jgi:hypothetical protein
VSIEFALVFLASVALWRLDAFARGWLELKRGPALQDTTPVPLPQDIEALAIAESESWAQDNVREAARERYAQYGDWNKVRAAMGLGLR